MPFADRSTSVHPVKRFSRFQSDSPWRSRTSLCITLNYNVALLLEISLFQFLQKGYNPLLALVSGAMLLWPLVRRTTGGPWVNTTEAIVLINRQDALVVDVRDGGDYGA